MHLRKISILAAALCLGFAGAQEPIGRSYVILTPELELGGPDNHAVEEVELLVSCGHIEAIAWIPNSWNIRVNRSVSAIESMNAMTGLGSARLLAEDLRKFLGSIRITMEPEDRSCFDVSGRLVIAGTNFYEVDITRDNLQLSED